MTLRERLSRPEILLAPGIYDGLTALFAERAGFEAAYLSGASIAYARFALPDIGLVTATEAAETLAAIRERATLPLIVDIDTGFGNALNVQRTVRLFERNGANALQIEDQVSPKRCGHLRDKAVIAADEMTGKIKAALDARRSPDTLVVARTDAIAVEGFERALDRAERYVEAGADVLFVEAPPDRAGLAEVGRRFGARLPVLANMVEGGKTPVKSADELGAIGYRIVIFPGGTARAVVHALQQYYASLHTHRTTAPMRGQMLDFDQLNGVIGTPELLEQGRRYG
jgi:2-methylisocitrate lyase-like PEP mutase family enzyme